MNNITLEQAEKIYRQAFVWDAHAGIFPDPRVDLNLLRNWYDNNVNYLSINVGFDVMDWQQTMITLSTYRRYVIAHGDYLVLANTLDDIERARHENKLALSFDIEGMNALNNNLDMVDVYYALGVRQMLFAYNLDNNAAGGCHDSGQGLTDFGRAVVERMNELGMLVDCSHVSHQASMDLIRTSSQPVVFSHSNPGSVWQHERNIHDDQIKACADTGGVIGINGMGIFLGNNDSSVEAIVKHVCYLKELVGTEHIGFGFDYSPDMELDVSAILRSRLDFWPNGNLYDTPHIQHAGPSCLPQVALTLFNLGWTENQLAGILGGNFLRVIHAVWPTAS